MLSADSIEPDTCYGLLHNLDRFKTVGASLDMLLLVLGPEALGCGNLNPKSDEADPS